jgi:DNA replication protein DnaC
MYKLQTALCSNGVKVKINQKQHWSEIQNRMITKYLVILDGFYNPIFESYKTHEIVQFLADMLNGGDSE